ncbi:MAG: DUF3667 domain-containing protein [Flavobacterium nitrogenifigens]|uniref:DUF3667 domain-containing protein n=1 Tax=Flavobacterium nitrogenifigens TaxID=1617283 RepID=UPI002807023B|nr:DUF3667 domain-containing protein [Flavobacterium nitrogenifigens]MDQ8013207.1 DUF3667 domain-containing protein [Flavobacterium nitrogenifigens]
MICKNCNTDFTGNYCPNCGQPASTHPINIHFLWHDIQHGLLHVDKGMLYTARELFTRPGHSVREFIEGKRVQHFKPISMLIVLATFYGFLYHYNSLNLLMAGGEYSSQYDKINNWMASHYSLYTLAEVPFFTLGTYIAFRKQGYNFLEYMILNSFKASQRLVLHIIAFPLLLHFNKKGQAQAFTNSLYILDVALIFWTNFQFFNNMSRIKVFLLSILSHLIMLCTLILIISIIILALKNL